MVKRRIRREVNRLRFLSGALDLGVLGDDGPQEKIVLHCYRQRLQHTWRYVIILEQ